MTREETILKMLEDKLGGKKVDKDAALKSLGIDSLDIVEIVSDAEEAFKIEFSNEELETIRTVQDIIDLANKKK
ncbi:MAG: phosphopantetheine-binding protein [Bacillales bacterium]|jgi:acyl carrier protein|nr:phosphopantetheine-binding protein [Bacillales bacterium]